MPAPRLLHCLLLLIAARCGGDDTSPAETAPPWEPAWALEAAVHETIGSIVVARWEQGEPCVGQVAYRFDDEDWQHSPARDLEPGSQEQVLLGIPYGAEVALRLEQSCAGGDFTAPSIETATDPLPEGLPHAAVTAAVDGAWDPSWRFVLTSLDSREDAPDPRDTWTIILDRRGRTVWALPTPEFRITMAPRVGLDRQSLLIDHNSFWAIFDAGAASQVQRVDLLGEPLATYDTPGLHHPFTELPDGTIAWGAAAGMTETIELLDPASGTQRTLWSCETFHREVGSMLPCSANTLNYDAGRGSYLISFFSTDTVVEVDATSGESLRWFGHLPGAWAFDPPDSAFYWQHGTNFTAAGTLLVSTLDGEPGEEILTREYELDEAQQTLHQIWSFGEGEGVWGYEMGEAWRLPGGNTLHNQGTAQRLREITPAGEVVWDASWTRGSFVGRSEGIEDLYELLP